MQSSTRALHDLKSHYVRSLDGSDHKGLVLPCFAGTKGRV